MNFSLVPYDWPLYIFLAAIFCAIGVPVSLAYREWKRGRG